MVENWSQGQKKLSVTPRLEFFSRAWTWQGGLPNNFPRFFGMYYHPPDHQNIKKTIWGGSKISQKWYPKIAIFCKTNLYIEVRNLYIEVRFALVFLGLSGPGMIMLHPQSGLVWIWRKIFSAETRFSGLIVIILVENLRSIFLGQA